VDPTCGLVSPSARRAAVEPFDEPAFIVAMVALFLAILYTCLRTRPEWRHEMP
jgi:hypothetical protein